jgi:hypothetical protein
MSFLTLEMELTMIMKLIKVNISIDLKVLLFIMEYQKLDITLHIFKLNNRNGIILMMKKLLNLIVKI